MTEPITKDDKQFAYLQRIETGETALTAYEPQSLDGAMALAKVISRSGLCPDALKNKDADILVVLMRGKEMGLSAIQSLQNLHVIYGKIGMSADLMRARCQDHRDCVRFEIVQADDKSATLEVMKAGWPRPTTVTFTLEEARKAGLVKSGGGYEKWTQDMLVARVTSRSARRYFPSVVAGLYTPEELSEIAPEPVAPKKRGAAGLVERLVPPVSIDIDTLPPNPEPDVTVDLPSAVVTGIPVEAWDEVRALKDGRKKGAEMSDWIEIFNAGEAHGWTKDQMETLVESEVGMDKFNKDMVAKVVAIFGSFEAR